MIRNYLWFDDYIRCRSGKLLPYYTCSRVEHELKDKELVWIHVGYGRMCLYRLWKVDFENFIAENLKIYCRTNDERWDKWLSNPELALQNNNEIES